VHFSALLGLAPIERAKSHAPLELVSPCQQPGTDITKRNGFSNR